MNFTRIFGCTAILIAILCTSIQANAKPPKGFHEGPYLRIVGGVVRTAFDNNARTGEKTAYDFEGAFGFQFGWNLWDTTAAEMEARYATKKIDNSREHIVFVNLNAKYSFVTNSLTEIGTLHILPFVQGGPAVMIAAVPGDPLTNNAIMTVWGLGFGGGFGIDFLFHKYVYFGILAQLDALYIPSVSQNIAGTPQTIISGGWEPQFGLTAAAGVHF